MMRSFHFYSPVGLSRTVGEGLSKGVTITESTGISSHYLDPPIPLLICKVTFILVGSKISAFKFQDCIFPSEPTTEKEITEVKIGFYYSLSALGTILKTRKVILRIF